MYKPITAQPTDGSVQVLPAGMHPMFTMQRSAPFPFMPYGQPMMGYQMPGGAVQQPVGMQRPFTSLPVVNKGGYQSMPMMMSMGMMTPMMWMPQQQQHQSSSQTAAPAPGVASPPMQPMMWPGTMMMPPGAAMMAPMHMASQMQAVQPQSSSPPGSGPGDVQVLHLGSMGGPEALLMAAQEEDQDSQISQQMAQQNSRSAKRSRLGLHSGHPALQAHPATQLKQQYPQPSLQPRLSKQSQQFHYQPPEEDYDEGYEIYEPQPACGPSQKRGKKRPAYSDDYQYTTPKTEEPEAIPPFDFDVEESDDDEHPAGMAGRRIMRKPISHALLRGAIQPYLVSEVVEDEDGSVVVRAYCPYAEFVGQLEPIGDALRRQR